MSSNNAQSISVNVVTAEVAQYLVVSTLAQDLASAFNFTGILFETANSIITPFFTLPSHRRLFLPCLSLDGGLTWFQM